MSRKMRISTIMAPAQSRKIPTFVRTHMHTFNTYIRRYRSPHVHKYHAYQNRGTTHIALYNIFTLPLLRLSTIIQIGIKSIASVTIQATSRTINNIVPGRNAIAIIGID